MKNENLPCGISEAAMAGRALGYFTAVVLWIFLSSLSAIAGVRLAGFHIGGSSQLFSPIGEALLFFPVLGTVVSIIQAKRGRGYRVALGQAAFAVAGSSLLFFTAYWKWIL